MTIRGDVDRMKTAADPTVLLPEDDGVGVASEVTGIVVVTCVGVT